MHKAQILKWLAEIRASYWLIPSLMMFAAIVASIVTVWIDGVVSSEWPEHIPLLFSNKPEGARSVLATVAGSMITVAGVIFSLTLLAVSHATGQFGPRLLGNFMRDRGNQLTLGTFIATFIYCLLVLRTVRGSEGDSAEATAFVPHISLTVALLLALCSVGVLIYFIHHIPESIRLSNVVSNIGRQLNSAIEKIFPEMIAEDQPDSANHPPIDDLPSSFMKESCGIKLDQSGYIQTVDESGLMKLADENDLIVFLECRPGDFYAAGKSLVRAWPGEQVCDSIEQQVRCLFALGNHRTLSQNVLFGFDQLNEVAQRALSPGINDPMTAITCMDWMETALISLAQRQPARVFRYNEQGKLRVFSRPLEFTDFCDHVFDQLRQSVASNRNATVHMIQMFNSLRMVARNQTQLDVLNRHAERLIAHAGQNQSVAIDLDELRKLNRNDTEVSQENVQDLESLFCR